jgi:DNA primase
MDKFKLIKESIPILEVFRRYCRDTPRLKGNKYYIKSPFNHGDKNPSCTIYPNSNTFYCFSTGMGGDSIKLLSSLFGIKPLEAVIKLSEDFNIPIEENTINKQKIQSIIKKNEELDSMAKTLENGLNLFYHKLTEFYKLFKELKNTAIQNSISKESLEYQFILFNYDFFDRYTEIFIFSDTKKIIYSYLNFKKNIEMEWREWTKWLKQAR